MVPLLMKCGVHLLHLCEFTSLTGFGTFSSLVSALLAQSVPSCTLHYAKCILKQV